MRVVVVPRGFTGRLQNKGAMMGCSNPHPHGQVWSLSVVPSLPATELAHMRAYAAAHTDNGAPGAPRGPGGRCCLLCEYAHYEAGVPEAEGRVVFKNAHWLAVVPWWAIWPFEVLRECDLASSGAQG